MTLMSGGKIPFTKQMDFEYTEVQQVTPLVRRVVARNPSGFTFYGTNTYIIGHGRVAIIDPGPLMKEHIGALRSALKEEIVEHILVTHTHHDHSPGVVPLREKVGGCIWGKLPKPIGEKSSTAESIDWSFSPDQELKDGTQVSGEGWTLEAIHTPGHMSNHMCFALAEERILFTGDHIMAWNTTLVSPPDGNMGDYFKSLEVCLSRDETVYWPAHGPEIINPKPFTRAYRNHRRMREGEIIRCLDRGLHKVTEIVEALYSHLPEKMHKAAGQSVLAHLEHMIETGRVKHYKNIGSEGHYENL
jgi:glyoxylase-like metal-dependent hydrolase (beta-lactamase superfamily II)